MTASTKATSNIEIVGAAQKLQKLLGENFNLLDALIELGLAPEEPKVGDTSVPRTPAITQTQRDALAWISENFGQVVPKAARKLTVEEVNLLAEERGQIDTVLGFLAKRKDVAIKEAVSNHFDKVAEEKGLVKNARVDKNGHYLLEQEVPAEDHGKKFVRQVTNPSPSFDTMKLTKAMVAGDVTREQYLALTSVPDVPRVIDAEKAAKSISKDPELLRVLAQYGTKPGTRVNSIWLRPDND